MRLASIFGLNVHKQINYLSIFYKLGFSGLKVQRILFDLAVAQ